MLSLKSLFSIHLFMLQNLCLFSLPFTMSILQKGLQLCLYKIFSFENGFSIEQNSPPLVFGVSCPTLMIGQTWIIDLMFEIDMDFSKLNTLNFIRLLTYDF